MHINSQWDGLKCLSSCKAIDFFCCCCHLPRSRCVFGSVSSCFSMRRSEMTVLMFTVFSPFFFSKIKASHVPVLIICFHWAWLKCWSHHLESDDSDLCFAYAWLESLIYFSLCGIWSLTLLKLPPELGLSLALTLSSSYHSLPLSKPLKHTHLGMYGILPIITNPSQDLVYLTAV